MKFKALFFLVCPLLLWAQSSKPELSNYHIQILNDSLYMFTANVVHVYPLKDVVIKPLHNELYENESAEIQFQMIPIVKDSAIHFVNPQGASKYVYENNAIVKLSSEQVDSSSDAIDFANFSTSGWLTLLLFVIGLSTIAFIVVKFKKKNKSTVRVMPNGLVYNKTLFEFDELELELINMLIDQRVVSSSDLLKLVENHNHNYSYNMRVKNELIERVNFKLKTMLQIDHNPICSEKSKVDKRFVDYRIDETYF